jgi:hypothetical protein
MPTAAETDAQRRRREEELLLLLGLFLWDGEELDYFTRTGHRVPQSVIRGAVNAVVAATREDVASLSRQAAVGEIDVAEWQDGMARRLKTMHIATAAAATGGFGNMPAAAVSRAEETLRFHLVKLDGFAADVAEGVTRLKSFQVDSETGELTEVVRLVRMIARAEMYVEAGASGSYEGGRRDAAIAAAYRFERNVLHPADHCEGCIGEYERGWVDIGTLVPIGQRTCLTRCQCSLQFAREIPQ